MCFNAWRHTNGGGSTEGRWAVGGGVGRPPYDKWGLPLLLEAWPTCHEWVWMVVDVCHVGYVAMTRQ
jgi:hypothetical protein